MRQVAGGAADQRRCKECYNPLRNKTSHLGSNLKAVCINAVCFKGKIYEYI